MLLDVVPNDWDVEVLGSTPEKLARDLARFGEVDLVGSDFGVFKLKVGGETFDFAPSRYERKDGRGHKAFEISYDENMTIRQAAQRRDFTINALYYDTRQKRVIDEVGGQADLQNRVLRHVSPAFAEDPLRVLRGMRFASRFDCAAAPETVELCHSLLGEFDTISKERFLKEWMEWGLKGNNPQKGLEFLVQCGWVEKYPEIKNLMGLEQDPIHHPEGDAFVHTCMVCNALAHSPAWQAKPDQERAKLMLAALCHDFGKPTTTKTEPDGRITSHGHEEEGVAPTGTFLGRIGATNEWKLQIPPLVANHMFAMAPIEQYSSRTIKRLAHRLSPANIDGLCLIMEADKRGRGNENIPIAAVDRIREIAATTQITTNKPEPILKGRHLVEAGMQPEPQMGKWLKKALEAQLDEEFDNLPEALTWLKNAQENHVRITRVGNPGKLADYAKGTTQISTLLMAVHQEHIPELQMHEHQGIYGWTDELALAHLGPSDGVFEGEYPRTTGSISRIHGAPSPTASVCRARPIPPSGATPRKNVMIDHRSWWG